MFHKKTVHKRLAMILGSIVGCASLGLIMTYAVLSTTQEIPDTETGTIGYALSKIIANNWQTDSIVGKSLQLGGVDGSKYLRLSGTGGCSNPNQALRSISPDGTSVQCETVLSTRSRPILATIRDLDNGCFSGGITVSNTGYNNGSTSTPPYSRTFSNSDPIDVYEDDTISTNGTCAIASLYMPDHSIVRLGANTKITLRYAGIAGGSGATNADLDKGTLWARVFKPITDDSYFNVNTQEASVGVRGTSLYIERIFTSGIPTTNTVAVDSGITPEPKNIGDKAVQISPSGSTGSITYLSLARVATIKKPPYSPTPTITIGTGTNAAAIYHTFPFTRISTMEDLHDFDTLRAGVGNLPTIAMTGGWLRGKDIYSTGVVQTATNGISKDTPKVANEMNRTDPNPGGVNPNTTTEESKICSTSSAAGALLGEIADIMSHEIRCSASNTLALIDREEGIRVANNNFLVKNTDGSFNIGNIVASEGTISTSTSSWAMKMDTTMVSSENTQHLLNIGSGSSYLRIYNDGGTIKMQKSGVPAQSISGLTQDTNTVFNFNLEKKYISGHGNYILTIKSNGTTIGTAAIVFDDPIQTLFIGKMATNNPITYWMGNIQNIQISK